MAPFAKDGGPKRKSWAGLVLVALFLSGFLAAGGFGAVGAITDTGTSSTTSTVSSSATTDTTPPPTSSSSTSTTTSTTPTSTDTTTTSTTTAATSTTTAATSTTTASGPAAALSTDKTSYTAGDTVVLSGSNFTPGESVGVHVVDTGSNGWVHDATATAAADGSFSASFALPLSFASSFTATATGATGDTASVSFSDTAMVASAKLTTDKATYLPGDMVTLLGSGWPPGESVSVHVADTGPSGWTGYDTTVSAAADGSFSVSFVLPLSFASTFKATATGPLGGSASVSFGDAFSGQPVPYIVTFAGGTSAADQLAEITAAGATDTGSIAPLNMHSITFPSDGAQAGTNALQTKGNVVRVEQDHSRDKAGTPNDPDYAQQWSLPRIGWNQVYGSVSPGGSATVAILDTGVDASHPDLAGKVVAGTNAITGSGDGQSDPNGHGTAMAGIVAAATDNGIGIAGIGYAGVTIMPVTVLNAQGIGYDSDVITGVVYAVQHGASVILMSFSNPGYSASLQSAIDWAWSQNVVIVAATGNDASTSPTYPAGDRGVVGVSSTGLLDTVSGFSN